MKNSSRSLIEVISPDEGPETSAFNTAKKPKQYSKYPD